MLKSLCFACLFVSRKLGVIDISLNLLNLLLSKSLESRYERKCKIILNEQIGVFCFFFF